MPRPEEMTKRRVEIWLTDSQIKYANKHLCKEKQSLKNLTELMLSDMIHNHRTKAKTLKFPKKKVA